MVIPDPRVVALLETAIADMRAAGGQIVEDFAVPGFETFARPPQTSARTKADWEAFFAYEGPTFPPVARSFLVWNDVTRTC